MFRVNINQHWNYDDLLYARKSNVRFFFYCHLFMERRKKKYHLKLSTDHFVQVCTHAHQCLCMYVYMKMSKIDSSPYNYDQLNLFTAINETWVVVTQRKSARPVTFFPEKKKFGKENSIKFFSLCELQSEREISN